MKTGAPPETEGPTLLTETHRARGNDAQQVSGNGAQQAHLGNGARPSPAEIREQDLQRQERFEDELIMDLERDQFVVETSRPVPPAVLSARVKAGLWVLRVFVVIVSLMVIYTFVEQLH
jgi:hypothetical protein